MCSRLKDDVVKTLVVMTGELEDFVKMQTPELPRCDVLEEFAIRISEDYSLTSGAEAVPDPLLLVLLLEEAVSLEMQNCPVKDR